MTPCATVATPWSPDQDRLRSCLFRGALVLCICSFFCNWLTFVFSVCNSSLSLIHTHTHTHMTHKSHTEETQLKTDSRSCSAINKTEIVRTILISLIHLCAEFTALAGLGRMPALGARSRPFMPWSFIQVERLPSLEEGYRSLG